MAKPKRLYRSRNDQAIAGVCGGLATYFSIDPTIVRLVFIIGIFLGVTSTIWIYLILWFIVPEEPRKSGVEKKREVVEVEVIR